MGKRLDLHGKLCNVFSEVGEWLWDDTNFEDEDSLSEAIKEEAKKHVYFQPPESLKLSYPCIVYERESADTKWADDKTYLFKKRYTVTVIDPNPDSTIIDAVAKLPLCRYDRHFTSDNLNHDVFKIYY